MDTKQLKQKILDLAIRGKLVPQDPNDEPASVLLERIRKEKEQLIASGKLKKSKSKTTDTPHYENVPFEIPDSWEWVTLGTLYNAVSAKRVLQADWKHNGVPFYRAREIVKLSQDGQVDNDLFISEAHYQLLKEAYGIPMPTDIMLSAVGTIGKTYIVKEEDKFYYKDASVLCLQNLFKLYSEYIQLALCSSIVLSQMFEQSKGTTVDTITIEKVGSYRFPLPPSAEQVRIVAEVNKWFALIDEIEANKSDLQKFIQQTKSKVLSLAISGKLVSQDPTDDPAIELLRRINPSFKPCDISHYENLPDGWCICRLEDIVDYEQPTQYIVESTEYSNDYKTPVLTPGKSFILGYTNETTGIYDKLPTIIFDDFTTDSRFVDFPFKVKSSAMKILQVHKEISIRYVAYFMSITRLAGDTHKRYWISEYSKIPIPLPPINEQNRIVQTIQDIEAKLNTITAEL